QGLPLVYLDGPAGTQVPRRVIDAMSDYFSRCNANHGGQFPTSRDSDAWVDRAHGAFADFVGAKDGREMVFGQNMTSLTFALARALAKTWGPGDEIIVTRLDHDANVTPWVLAAQDAGVTVQYVRTCLEDCTLDMEDFRQKLTEKTRLIAVGAASNSVGTINPVSEMVSAAHGVGAKVFVDAVHYAPHQRMDVKAWNCDFLACSAYKYFGPHLGILWGRRELLESLEAYKVRPAPSELPGKWMTGTQSFESIVGGLAALDYIAEIGENSAERGELSRSEAYDSAFSVIREYEMQLASQFIEGISALSKFKLWGIQSKDRLAERMPTFAITHDSMPSIEVARYLGDKGICVWHGHYYALNLSADLGREPAGMVRLGLTHYNLAAEVERVLGALAEVG
ncbi:MAG: cysteine desulfurase-like protein, partial [Planctomycetota bacterium]|nr:cysteine desulfurase-like protein [Planctomycetota bacterium]